MINIIELKNGLKVAYEKIEHMHSVSVGLWVKAGSMLEDASFNGLSHFMEHMAFKGTAQYNAKELAERIDSLGGVVNAATSKTNTVYYAQVLKEKLPETISFIADIVLNASLDENEIEKEKNVVLEEIAMAEDNPEDLAYDKLSELQYKGGSLARPILGSCEIVSGITKKDIVSYRNTYYLANQAVLSVVGNFDEEELLCLAERYFAAWKSGKDIMYPPNRALADGGSVFVSKQIEQVHMCLGYQGKSDMDTDLYVLAVLSNIFGGGVSSRLFQAVREEKALVYTIYSSISSFPNCGDFIIYAAATPKNRKKVLGEINRQVDTLLSDGVTKKELEQTKIQLKTATVLSQESPYRQMSKLASNLLTYGRYIPIEEVLGCIDAVDEEKVLRVAKEVFVSTPCISMVGHGTAKER